MRSDSRTPSRSAGTHVLAENNSVSPRTQTAMISYERALSFSP